VQSNAGKHRRRVPGCPPTSTRSSVRHVFQLLTGCRESPLRGGRAAWWERRGGTGERCAAADRPDLNSETSVAARPACVSGGRERGGGKRDWYRWVSRRFRLTYCFTCLF